MSEKDMIRLAKKSDCQNLAALSIQVWMHTYATEGVRNEISNYVLTTFTEKYYLDLLEKPSYKIFVYVEKPNLLGFIVVNLESFFKSETNGFEICIFYVQEHFQNQGIGKSLLNTIKEKHGEVFWLSTWVHNTAAISFYKKNGFKDIGSRNFQLGDEFHENLILSYNSA
jgi:ribosomal protein S18 acetylase RimI-like enzyme